MPAKLNKQNSILIIINVFSFLFLILTLNFNVRTFRLTQQLQSLTISLQELERQVEEDEYAYYVQTRLDLVYEKAMNELDMHRQSSPVVFVNSPVNSR
ncbi:MAG: hypothetical protein VW397_02535 [Candidatus Margulisiibacteriota bacterium]